MLLHYYLEAQDVQRENDLTATTSSQTTKELSSNTPRKKKQRKIIKSQRQKIKQLSSALCKVPSGKKSSAGESLGRCPTEATRS